MTERTQTCAVECDLEAGPILHVLSDPSNLPRWAPQFAPSVEINPAGGWMGEEAIAPVRSCPWRSPEP
jgi:hypothetical protein